MTQVNRLWRLEHLEVFYGSSFQRNGIGPNTVRINVEGNGKWELDDAKGSDFKTWDGCLVSPNGTWVPCTTRTYLVLHSDGVKRCRFCDSIFE